MSIARYPDACERCDRTPADGCRCHLVTAKALYKAHATGLPEIAWEALTPREQAGWKYAATCTEFEESV